MEAHLDTTGVARDGYSGTKLGAWLVLLLTFSLMLFDFIDRQIVVSMLPLIKAEWALSDTQLGALVSVVSVTIAIFSLPIAYLADRWSRVRCVFAMALLWSLATIACGYATSYAQLLALRGTVGLGEAGYNAVGAAILSSRFPSWMRGTILASFSAAAAFGAVLGTLAGGILAKHYGWHSAFGIVGIPGLILAFLYLLVRDYGTIDVSEQSAAANRRGIGITGMLRALRATPSAAAIYVGAGLQLFVVSTVYSWLPSFFGRYYSLPPDQAGVKAAVVLMLSSLAAVLWGLIQDLSARRGRHRRIVVMAFASLLSFLVLTFAFGYLAPGPQQFMTIIVGAMFMTAAIGSPSAVAIDVVPTGMRATTVAVGVLITNMIGLGAGPFVSGMVSDTYGLNVALAVVPIFGLLAAIAFALTIRPYRRDLATIGGGSRDNVPPTARMATV